MANTLADTVKALLLKGAGDRRLLEQILRAAARHEAISRNEREYVEQLRREHLDPLPARPQPKQAPPAQQLARPEEMPRKRRSRKKYVVIAAAAAAAVLGAGAYAALGGAALQPLSVNLDGSSYARGDIIAISGDSTAGPGPVSVYISDASGRVIWSEETALEPDGSFSTLAVSGGPGWGGPGAYAVVAAHEDLVQSTEFEFRG